VPSTNGSANLPESLEEKQEEATRSSDHAVALVVLAFAACVGMCILHLIAAPSALALTSPTEAIQGLASFILHIDKHLTSLVAQYGAGTYALLFAIVFAETGLVVTPFLPGDSLLFAAGALAALGALSLPYVMITIFTAAVVGDAVNYTVGAWLGKKMLESKFLKAEYIEKTEGFYEKYGGKTIILARFVPIVRTFAPFVAGVGTMTYSKFATYNIVGAAVWTGAFTLAGFLFGTLPVVQHNFTIVILGIVAISVVPIVIEILQSKREGTAATPAESS